MKSGKNLQQLAAEIYRQHNAKRDFLAPVRQLRIVTESRAIGLDAQDRPRISTVPTMAIAGHGSFGLAPMAVSQLATYLDIPLSYLKRCEQGNPDLFAANVNHWLAIRSDKRFVRTLDGQARAFLSDRYTALDHHDLVEAVLPVLVELGVEIESCEITESKLYLKAVNRRVTSEITTGDVVQAGVIISNSEIGVGCLRIAPLVYRLVCKNGLVASDASMKKYHIGRNLTDSSMQEVWQVLSDDARRKTNAAIWAQVRDVTRSALSEALFSQIVDKMRLSRQQPIEAKDVDQVIERTATRYTLSSDERQGILRHLLVGNDLSQYGLLNAITRQSQEVESYDRATELEEIGGRVLDLTHSDWRGLAA